MVATARVRHMFGLVPGMETATFTGAIVKLFPMDVHWLGYEMRT